MNVPTITITPAGLQALLNSENTGTAATRVTQIGVTEQAFNPATVGATLPGERKRITSFGGKAVASDTLHINMRDDSADTYTLRGFGLYFESGVLFAVYSQATPIMEKASAAMLLLATDIRFANIDATSIEVGQIDFINPPATTTQVGVARFATDIEAIAGASKSISLTPWGMAAYINSRFGDSAPSAFVKGLLSAATAAIFRTALELGSAATKNTGHGQGLDADTLDGQHGDYYRKWSSLTDVPTRFTPADHQHQISDIVSLDSALAAKLGKSENAASASRLVALDFSLNNDANNPGGAEPRGVSAYAFTNINPLNTPDNDWATILTAGPMSSGATRAFQIGFSWNVTDSFAMRTLGGAWRKLYHTGNFDPNTKVNVANPSFTGTMVQRQNVAQEIIESTPNAAVRYRRLVNISDAVDGGYRIDRWNGSEYVEKFQVNDGGASVRGALTVTGPSSFSEDCVRTSSGTDKLAGYMTFHRKDGTRLGYVGWGSGTNLQYSVENGYTGHSFVGNMFVGADLEANGRISTPSGISVRGESHLSGRIYAYAPIAQSDSIIMRELGNGTQMVIDAVNNQNSEFRPLNLRGSSIRAITPFAADSTIAAGGSISTAASMISAQNFTTTTAAAVLASVNGVAGNVYLRPNGASSTAGQFRTDSLGNTNTAGTATSNGLQVNGNGTITGNLTINGVFNRSTGSSYKLKNIEGKLPYGLDQVRKIKTVIGRYKSDYCDDHSLRAFVISEQLYRIIPEAVKRGVINYKGQMVDAVDYEMLIPPLINAVSQQADIVDQQAAVIETMLVRLERLEARG